MNTWKRSFRALIILSLALFFISCPSFAQEYNEQVPQQDPDAGKEIPSRDPDAGKEVPVQDPDAGKEVPVQDPDAGKEVPIYDPDAGKEIPIRDPDAGKEIYIHDPDAGKEVPIQDPDAGKGKPFYDADMPVPEGGAGDKDSPKVLKEIKPWFRPKDEAQELPPDLEHVGMPNVYIKIILPTKGQIFKDTDKVRITWTKKGKMDPYVDIFFFTPGTNIYTGKWQSKVKVASKEPNDGLYEFYPSIPHMLGRVKARVQTTDGKI